MGLEKKKFVFNPITGTPFDYIAIDNHSYNLIPLGRTGLVQAGQEMHVKDTIQVDGSLKVDGTIVMIGDDSDHVAPLNPVPTGRVLRIYDSEQCLMFLTLRVDGSVKNDGSIVIIGD